MLFFTEGFEITYMYPYYQLHEFFSSQFYQVQFEFFYIFNCVFSSEDLLCRWFIRNFIRNENVLCEMVQKGGCYASGQNAGDIILEIGSASDSYWNIYCGIKII